MNQNQELIKKAKEILKKVQASGGEAFIIGETIFKLINGKPINNVYIYMTLSETKFIEEFSAFKIKKINKKKFSLGYFGYNYIVTCDNQVIDRYRLAKTKVKSHYSRNIINAICQNDYTIYAMAMNYNGIIYDMFQARDDIYKKKINSVFYKPQELFKDTPSKMLDVIKLVSQTGYKLENKVVKAIKLRSKYIKKIDISVVSKYLKLIIEGDYSKDAFRLLYKTKLYKYLTSYKFAIKRCAQSNKKDEPYVFFGLGMVKNKLYNPLIGKIFTDETDFQNFIDWTIQNPQCDFSPIILFNNGLDKCLMSNKINYVLGRSKNKSRIIRKEHNSLVIKNVSELAISCKEIKSLFPKLSDGDITIIIDDLTSSVLEKIIKNKYEILKQIASQRALKILGEMPHEKRESNVSGSNVLGSNVSGTNVIGNSEDLSSKTDNNINNVSAYAPGMSVLEEMQKRQVELQKKLEQMENDALRRELNDEIERKINATGILNDFDSFRKESVKKIIYGLYYDSLIETEKYKKLKE